MLLEQSMWCRVSQPEYKRVGWDPYKMSKHKVSMPTHQASMMTQEGCRLLGRVKGKKKRCYNATKEDDASSNAPRWVSENAKLSSKLEKKL